MRRFPPYLVLLGALAVAALALFGDDSISRLRSLRAGVDAQQRVNRELGAKVDSLDSEVRSLQRDPRALERAARNELGLARPDEAIFLFDHKQGDDTQGVDKERVDKQRVDKQKQAMEASNER